MAKAKVMLFTSPTCPHCPAAKEFMKKYSKKREDIIYIEYSTATREGYKKAQKYNVMSVPTFIIKGPGYDPIGLRGLQSEKIMDKYVDVALGKKTVEEKKENTFLTVIKKILGME